MKRVIVTGGAGFIGHHLINFLLKQKNDVLVIDNLSTGRRDWLPYKTKFIKLDIKDIQKLIPIFKDAENVYHLAASARIQRSWDHPKETWQDNVEGTHSVLEAARINKIKRIMITSSNSVYGEWGLQKPLFKTTENLEPKPISPYAFHKLLDEKIGLMYSKCWKMDVLVVRPFNIYGEDQQLNGSYSCVFPKFLEAKQKNQPMPIFGNGNQARDFTYISDTVEAMWRLIQSKRWKRYEIVNICYGMPLSINGLVNLMNGQSKYIVPSPRKNEMEWTWGNNEKLKKLTDFVPKISVQQFLKSMK